MTFHDPHSVGDNDPRTAGTDADANGTRYVTRADHVDAIRRAAADLEDAKLALNRAVIDANDNGITWQEIGAILGISRQGAHERFRR